MKDPLIKKLNSKGIGLLPVIVVAGILGLVVVAGFAVYQASQDGAQINRSGSSLVDDDGDFHIGNNNPISGSLGTAAQADVLDELTQAQQQLLNEVSVERIGSDNRYLTAIEVSKLRYPNKSPNGVVIVNGESYPDAVVGIGLSYTNSLLYLPPGVDHTNETFRAVADEIKRLGVNKITVVGGEAAISTYQITVLEDLLKLPPSSFERIPGASRIETSVNAAKKFYNFSGTVFIANGYREADSALFQRGYEEGPLVFVNENGSMHPATLEYLRSGVSNLTKIVALGGDSEDGVTEQTLNDLRAEFGTDKVYRIAGQNRYHTATAVSQQTYEADCNCTLYLVNTVAEADAVMASVQAGSRNGPVLFADVDRIPLQTAEEIKRLNPNKVVVVGGTARISEDTAQVARAIAAGVLLGGTPSSDTTAAADRCEELGYEVEYNEENNNYHCDSRIPL